MIAEAKPITAAEIKRLLLDVYRRFRRGLIDAEQARQEAYLLNSCLEAVAESETNERLQELQNILRGD
jgi:DNA-directed RNA polymerase subunit F